MKINVIILLLFTFLTRSLSQLPNILNEPIRQCIRCICHARTACYDLKQCARVSIDYNYWQTAGAPRLRAEDSIDTQAYEACINDDNCIVHTIKQYVYDNNNETQRCNYLVDDCRDGLLLHINKRRCDRVERRYTTRFDNCAFRSNIPSFGRDSSNIGAK